MNDTSPFTNPKKMIANLGYSTIQCMSIPLNQKVLSLTCPYGKITKIAE